MGGVVLEALSNDKVASHRGVNNRKVPHIIDVTCPACLRSVSMHCNKYKFDDDNQNAMLSAVCPACKFISQLWLLNADDHINSKLYMYPTPKSFRKEMEHIEVIPEGLQKAYIETLDVYRSNKWIASSVMARRTLEGILVEVLGNKEANLFTMLKELPNKVNLTDKIIEMANGIRKAGNLGAHYDEDKEPNEEIATMLLDFLEYLLEFVFVLPEQAKDLNKRILQLNKKEDLSEELSSKL